MVITKLMGGLGNQMFQYATARALSLHLNTGLKVDTSFLEADANGAYTQRQYELEIFKAHIDTISAAELDRFLHSKNNPAKKLLNKLLPALFKNSVFTELGPYYHPDIWKAPNDIYLSGFWQCEDYFSKYRSALLKDFEIKLEIIAGTEDWLAKIKETNSVAVHVRRGDYVSNAQSNAFHGICTPDYYEKAINHLAATQTNLHLFVFSDDLQWCRSNFSFPFPLHFVDTASAFKDLYLMQHCRHQIIANSSFSWWAAWLNTNPGKIVVAPKLWFREPEMQKNEIIPQNWIKL